MSDTEKKTLMSKKKPTKTIELPCYGIKFRLFGKDNTAFKQVEMDDEFDKIILEACLDEGFDDVDEQTWWDENGLYYQTAVEPYRSLLKNCARAGVDVESPAFIEAIESSIQEVIDNVGD